MALTVGEVIGIVGGICGIVGAVCGVPALWYARKQLKITERLESRDDEDAKWLREFTGGVEIILRIHPRWLAGNLNAYGAVFPDPDFRSRVENYLITIKPQGGGLRATGRAVDVNLLRVPVVRQTIEQAKQQIEKFRDENPQHRAQLDL